MRFRRKTTENKVPFHPVLPRVHTLSTTVDLNMGHPADVVFVRFLRVRAVLLGSYGAQHMCAVQGCAPPPESTVAM